jgi:hypothetical protein
MLSPLRLHISCTINNKNYNIQYDFDNYDSVSNFSELMYETIYQLFHSFPLPAVKYLTDVFTREYIDKVHERIKIELLNNTTHLINIHDSFSATELLGEYSPLEWDIVSRTIDNIKITFSLESWYSRNLTIFEDKKYNAIRISIHNLDKREPRFINSYIELDRRYSIENSLSLVMPKVKRIVSRYTRAKLDYDNLIFNIINNTSYFFSISIKNKKHIKLNLVNLYEFE